MSRSLAISRIGKIAALVLFALILSFPTPAGMQPAAHRLAAVTALMAILWMTQALPIAATSLLPLVLFPLLGIQTASIVSNAYIDKQVFLYLGGFIIALGIENCGLHRRLALHVVRLIGESPRRIVLGFMVATAFLSMWISNTAATLLMYPIALAMLRSLVDVLAAPRISTTAENVPRASAAGLTVPLMLGVAYAASIGGMTTLVGTPTNVAFVGIWQNQFPDAPEISVGQWMTLFVPVGVVFLICSWGVVTFRLSPLPGKGVGRAFFTGELRKLGRPSRAEVLMFLVLSSAAALWVFQQPLQIGSAELLPGWGVFAQRWLVDILGTSEEFARGAIHDSTVAIAMAILMFLLPGGRDEQGEVHYLMDWETAEKLPWGILLLIGGGFAIAGAFRETDLSAWIGQAFASTAEDWSPLALVAGVCLLMTFLTEFTSNVATVNTILPMLAGVSVSLDMDPLLLMIPATASASCAFMLPIATPPNAIVFSSGRVTVMQMMSYGFVLNVIGIVLITLATFALLVPQLSSG